MIKYMSIGRASDLQCISSDAVSDALPRFHDAFEAHAQRDHALYRKSGIQILRI